MVNEILSEVMGGLAVLLFFPVILYLVFRVGRDLPLTKIKED